MFVQVIVQVMADSAFLRPECKHSVSSCIGIEMHVSNGKGAIP